MEKLKEERIKEIDERIVDLKEHATMWARAGGRGGMMAMDARAEVKELELEREDLINGTNKLAIYRIEKELERLTYLRRDANVFQRVVYNSKIKKLEKELYALKDKDRNISVPNESELIEENLDNVVGGVPYEVGKEIAERQNTVDNDYINYEGDDSYSVDESTEIEEKGRSR